MSALEIRPLDAADIEPLQSLDLEAHGSAWSQRVFVDDIDQPDRVHLVGVADDALVSHVAACLDGSILQITNVATRATATGHGHATALLLEVLDRAVRRAPVRTVRLEVRPTNRRAQRLYNRFGFVPVGIAREFYDRADSSGSCDAVVMVVPDVHAPEWHRRIAALRTTAEAAA